MATSLGLHPPQFSEDVAWLPCWLQNLRTNGSNEFVKESQAPSNQEVKDPAPSEKGSSAKYVLSRGECGYKSCHLFLSGEDCSPTSFGTPENVFHFSLHLSSDVDSVIFPTQDLNAFHDAVSPSKICSSLPVQASIDFGENMNSTADHHAYEQNLLPALIPETVKTDASKSLIDTNDSIRQQEEKPSKCFISDCISDAVELSIAASEALVINDLVKMESVSETMHTENVLEVALRVKQARLEWLDDGFSSSCEDSGCSDSLSDLNDFIMEQAYGDIGLLSSVPSAENYSRCNTKQSDKELTTQLANFEKSEEKKLEFNVEMETRLKGYSPLDSGSNTPKHFENGLPMPHHLVENNSNALAVNQLDPSSLNWNNANMIPEFHIRETSFLSESIDIVPDESSCVQKHDSECAIGSQLNMHSDCLHNKPDDSMLHSQDMVRCSSLSLIDPLCSVVPCSISSQHAISNADIDKEHNTKIFVSPISGFVVNNFQKISDKNATLDCRVEQLTSVLDSKDIPIAPMKVVKLIPNKLPGVEHIGREQLNSLKTCHTTLPNQDLNLNGNLTPLLTNQNIGCAASLDSRISESLSASKCENRNQHEENPGYFVDHIPFLRITDNKTHDGLTIKAVDASGILEESIQDRRSPLILNNRTRRRSVGPKIVVDDVGTNPNLNRLQVVSTKYNGENVQVRKRVHFSEKVEELHQKRKISKLEPSFRSCSSVRQKRQRVSKSLTTSELHMTRSLMNCCRRVVNEFIFCGTEFLLTGLSSHKEKDMEALIRNSGGVVLYDIPSPNSRGKRSSTLSRLQLPIILCLKKMKTTKFLYGCAVGASILKVDWLTDCLASGTILQPEKYLILPNRNDMKWTRIGAAVHHRDQKHIFDRVGIMLHGRHRFCNKLAVIIKHGGGKVFKTLQWLVRSCDEKRTSVAAIVAEDNTTISRHLKHCALEGGIPIMPCSWIVKSLYSGKLLPFMEEENKSPLPFERVSNSVNLSEEI